MSSPPDASAPARVLVVDDAVVVRRLVADVLGAEAEIEVVGTAANGRLALDKLPLLQPELVVLDIEMPELDGLGTLAEIRKIDPRLPVIMFSTLTERGASATLDALSLGASDYVTKPSNTGGFDLARERVRNELVPKVLGLVTARRQHGAPRLLTAPKAPGSAGVPSLAAAPPSARGAAVPAEVVVIGVSTGGPNALAALIGALPASLAVPVVIVQHMPPVFTRLLAERLDAAGALSVAEATDGEALRPGRVLVAPGGVHLVIERTRNGPIVRHDDGPQENFCKPAVDPLFRSAAAYYGKATLGVVLTGMGHDGAAGARAIVDAGGRVVVQDAATSAVWGMPGAIHAAGLADAVLDLADIAPEVARRCRAKAGALR